MRKMTKDERAVYDSMNHDQKTLLETSVEEIGGLTFAVGAGFGAAIAAVVAIGIAVFIF